MKIRSRNNPGLASCVTIQLLSKQPSTTPCSSNLRNREAQRKTSIPLPSAKIIAVSDSKGGIFSAAGLDLTEVERFKARQNTVVGLAVAIERVGHATLLRGIWP